MTTTLAPQPRLVPPKPAPRSFGDAPCDRGTSLSAAALRNISMMRLAERVVGKLGESGVRVMVLKGAALNATVYDQPDERLMDDLDLMVRPEDLDATFAVLESMGGLRGLCGVRADYFPRFYYELDYTIGTIDPVKIDLHVRPFRPLRYARTVPDDAFWRDAEEFSFGRAKFLLPNPEDMLIHLATHAAVHACARPTWVCDLQRWVEACGHRLDWDRFIEKVRSWKLGLPVREALARAEEQYGSVVPDEVRRRLREISCGWRDRLALRQAPRDATHAAAHVLVNTTCTPGLRFVLAYLWSIILPDRAYMADWYGRRHAGWRVAAHVLRWLGPLGRYLPLLKRFRSKVELRPSPIHGLGVFAQKDIAAGDVIAWYFGRRVDRDGMYVVRQADVSGGAQRYELTGKLMYLNHSCAPNSRFKGFELVATRSILRGHEVTISYGPNACDCAQRAVVPQNLHHSAAVA